MVLKTSLIFFCIIFIMGIFEELSFFSQLNANFYLPIILVIMNSFSVIYLIFPFIFLIAAQFFFIKIIDTDELITFKSSGLSNNKILSIVALTSFLFGIVIISVFYNVSAILKFKYLDLKNEYTNDNKYLASVTENGLWIKDEINNNINIINSNNTEDEFLLDVTITQFNKNFEILNIIYSKKVDISTYRWKIFEPLILRNNQEIIQNEMILTSNFDLKKINSLFSNLSSLTMFELFELRKSYNALNYSVVDIDSHLYKIFSYPIYLTLITIFSAIIMFNIAYQKNSFFKIILGIFLSVVIYYINYFLNILGTNEKIPLILSIFMPLIILSIINFISILKLNEK